MALNFVTSARSSDESVHERARALALRFDLPYVSRSGQGVQKLFAKHGGDAMYVVAKDSEWVAFQEGQKLRVHESLFRTRLLQTEHPLLRAFASAEGVVDATCGLAKDTMLLATRFDVYAFEKSKVIHALLESAFEKWRKEKGEFGDAARRVTLFLGSAEERSIPKNHGVYFDPMWPSEKETSSEMSLLRRLACADGLDGHLIQTLRLNHQVVVKAPRYKKALQGFDSKHVLASERARYFCARAFESAN